MTSPLPLTMALYFALGALGGLWMPLSTMPHAMQDIGQTLRSNGVAELGWRIAGGQASVPRAYDLQLDGRGGRI